MASLVATGLPVSPLWLVLRCLRARNVVGFRLGALLKSHFRVTSFRLLPHIVTRIVRFLVTVKQTMELRWTRWTNTRSYRNDDIALIKINWEFHAARSEVNTSRTVGLVRSSMNTYYPGISPGQNRIAPPINFHLILTREPVVWKTNNESFRWFSSRSW